MTTATRRALAHDEDLLHLRMSLPIAVRCRTLVVGEHLICQDPRIRGGRRYSLPAGEIVLAGLGHKVRYRTRIVPSCGISLCVHPGHLLTGRRLPSDVPIPQTNRALWEVPRR